MPCVGRGYLPTVSLRGLFKRIRFHVACCQGVVAVIEATDGSQGDENDMKDGETGSTHSAKNVFQSRSFRWFHWCQTLGRCCTCQRRETIYHAKMAGISTAGRRFKRDQVILNGKDEQWQADLVDVQALKKDNEGYRFLLTVIDVLSKYAWVVPLKDKTGKSPVDAFDAIFKEGR